MERPGILRQVVVAGAVATIGVAAIAGWILLAGSSIETMPDNATLLIHESSMTYASPVCVMREETSVPFGNVTRRNGKPVDFTADAGVATLSRADARSLKAQPDARCSAGSGFLGAKQPAWKSMIGLSPESRWDSDGNWRW